MGGWDRCTSPFSPFLDVEILTSLQIYHMVFGYRPFMTLKGRASLVSQMIHFVEDLPDE
jgi:hypothetical protein